MNRDCIYKLIKEKLTEKRFKHTMGVVEMSRHLAEKHNADVDKAELAALLHDMYKCITIDESNEYVNKLGLGRKYINNPNLAHSKIAACMIKTECHINDEDVINAVSFHTTGRKGMSALEKIIYLADAIEMGRKPYPGIEEIRQMAEEDLDGACIMSLERTAEYVKARNQYLDKDTFEALEDLKKKKEN